MQPFTNDSEKPSMNGVFVVLPDDTTVITDFLFLYENGLCRSAVNGTTRTYAYLNSIPMRHVINQIIIGEGAGSGYCKENWGHYFIREDSIFIQVFNIHPISTNVRRDVSGLIGIISNDSTILILRKYYDGCNLKTLTPGVQKRECLNWGYKEGGFMTFDEPVEYKFFKSPEKPDSSFAWFREKKWYRNEVHYRKD